MVDVTSGPLPDAIGAPCSGGAADGVAAGKAPARSTLEIRTLVSRGRKDIAGALCAMAAPQASRDRRLQDQFRT
jgi:hypothetical protein